MKTPTCKLARIATVACTSVAPLAVAHAQQAEAVVQTMAKSAASADAPLALPREESVSASANLPIVDATESDAQCVTDAARASSVAVLYAAPRAVPVHTDTVATMSTPTAAPFLADAQANELEWGRPRRDAMSLADADVAAPVRAVPLENAARVHDARDLRDGVREDADEATREDTPQDAARGAALPRAAQPVLLPIVPLPVHKPPISYAAPVAVPVRTAKADVQARVAAASVPHVSYAAPVAVTGTANAAHTNERTRLLPSPDARIGATLLAHAQPLMLMHMNSSDTTAADPHALPVRLILPPPTARQTKARTAFASAIDSQRASTSEALPEAVTQVSAPQATQPQATQPQATPSKAKPVSYAAPIAVPSRGDSSAAANREAQPAAQPQLQPPAHVATAATPTTDKTDPNWSMPDKLAVSDERLDKMRGGFDLSSGLKVSFGVSRMVVVNGNLVTTTSFNIPDLANLSAQQAQQLASVNAGSLIQNGPGNIVQSGAMPALSGAVIQNTLNNQNIQALTTINTTVNSLSMFKNFNVGSTLGGALANAVRPR